MFLFPRATSGSAVPATVVRPIASSALLLSLPAVDAETAKNLNGTVPEGGLSLASTTKTGLSTLIILAIILAGLFVFAMFNVLGYALYLRWREGRKRSKHHKETLEFQAMARKGLRPDWGAVTTQIPVAYPSQNPQATLPPLVPNRAYAV